jgi:hypothetical protein
LAIGITPTVRPKSSATLFDTKDIAFNLNITNLSDSSVEYNIKYSIYDYYGNVYNNTKDIVNVSEHYWSMGWAKVNAESWLDYIPLPKRHSKKYNKQYIEQNKADYLMLDFIEIK